MTKLDGSIRFGNHEVAKQEFLALSEFVGQLSKEEREALTRDFPAWSNERRSQLKLRWQALDEHHGSWEKWRSLLTQHIKSGAPSREVLLAGARDLVYMSSPGVHRHALWCFCCSHTSVDNERFTVEIENLLGEDVDRSQVEQMWLDVQRAPCITSEQQVLLVRILRVHC